MSIFSQNIDSTVRAARTIRGSEFWKQIVENCILSNEDLGDADFYTRDDKLCCRPQHRSFTICLNNADINYIKNILPEIDIIDLKEHYILLKSRIEISKSIIDICKIRAKNICTCASIIRQLDFRADHINMENPHTVKNTTLRAHTITFDRLTDWPYLKNVSILGAVSIRYNIMRSLEAYGPFLARIDFWKKIKDLHAKESGGGSYRIHVPEGFAVSDMIQDLPDGCEEIRIECDSYELLFTRRDKTQTPEIKIHPCAPAGMPATEDGWSAYICL